MTDFELLAAGLQELNLSLGTDPAGFPSDSAAGTAGFHPTEPEDSGFFHSIELFLNELEMWNRRVRLISGSRRDIIIRHLLDSLAAYPLLRRLGVTEIADVGSGNGFPAIPFALLDSSLHIAMVERGGKKSAFLRNMVGLLQLRDRVEVLEKDVKLLDRKYPLVMSRAFMPMSRAVPLLRSTVGKNATLFFFAGTQNTIQAELDKLAIRMPELSAPHITSLEVPYLDEQRHICIFPPQR